MRSAKQKFKPFDLSWPKKNDEKAVDIGKRKVETHSQTDRMDNLGPEVSYTIKISAKNPRTTSQWISSYH